MKKIRMVDKLEIHLTEDPMTIVQNTYSETFPEKFPEFCTSLTFSDTLLNKALV